MTTPAEARRAVTRGANRVLLGSALELGGLTPSRACFRAVCQAVQEAAPPAPVPITVLIRPWAGGFCYSVEELDQVYADATQFLDDGADGIAFGILRPAMPKPNFPGDNGKKEPTVTIDIDRCYALVELAKSQGKEAIFHRAFDFLTHCRNGLHELVVLGCQQVLASGGAALALDDTGVLATDIQFAAWDIEVVPCGGIRAGHLKAILQHTH